MSLLMTVEKFRIPPAPRDWLDGYAIPRGKTTLLAVPGGSGKTTAALTAAIGGATDGVFHFFGRREHRRQLRSMIITAEETGDDLKLKMAAEHGDKIGAIEAAIAGGRLGILSLPDAIEARDENGDIAFPGEIKLFNEEGVAAEGFDVIAAEIEKFRPDFVYVDTLGAISKSDYMDGNSPYATIGRFDRLADRVGCAIVIAAHLTKEGSGKNEINENTPPGSIIGSMRGSGQLTSAARHVIVLAEATGNAFKKESETDRQRRFGMVIKSNLGHPDAMKVLPVIRDENAKTFVATDGHRTLLSIAEADRLERLEKLPCIIEQIVYAASLACQPFVSKGKFSVAGLSRTVLDGALPDGTTDADIELATDRLIRTGQIQAVRVTQAGATPVYDTPGGQYALEGRTGQKAEFKKGAADRGYLVAAAQAGSMAEVLQIFEATYQRRGEGQREALEVAVADAAPAMVGDDAGMREKEMEEEGFGDAFDPAPEPVELPPVADDWMENMTTL